MPDTPFRNVFILCTGRCGSTTFDRACRHITNWTSGHETRSHLLGPERLAYPPRHIEADNRLSWMLGRLDRAYGRDAAYVHLTRDAEDVARSYAGRAAYGLMRAYARGIILPAPGTFEYDDRPVMDHARDMVETVTTNIETFLSGKPHVMRMRLEDAATDFPAFWDWIGASGRLDLALQEWSIRHNETLPRARGRIGRVLSWPKRKHASHSSPEHRAG